MSLPPLYDESDYEALREEKDRRIAELEAALAERERENAELLMWQEAAFMASPNIDINLEDHLAELRARAKEGEPG